MAKRSKPPGIRKDGGPDGRGRSSGSSGTRFPKGESGNPAGRPRKDRSAGRHENAVTTIRRQLAEAVPVTENGKTVKMRRLEAMLKSMLHDFPKATFSQRIELLKLLMSIGADQGSAEQMTPSPKTIEEVVEELAANYERTHGVIIERPQRE